MNVIKFHTGKVIGNFIEVPSGSLDDVLFSENKCFNLKIKYNASINNNNVVNETEQIFNFSKVKYIKDVTEEDCSKLFLEIDPPILNMESPVELKYKFGKYSYANALDCFKDLLEENNLKITDNYLIIT